MSWMRILAGILVPALLCFSTAAWPAQDADVVLTVNRVIYPGQVVPADAIVETRLRRPLRNGLVVLRDTGDLVGKIAARTILPRRLIVPDAVRDAYAIEAGEAAIVYYRHGALVIAMDAVALTNAGVGETIRVRNSASGRTVAGIVQPDGTVVVAVR